MSVVNITAAGAHAAVNGEVAIVKAAGVTINLPVPASGQKITVKMEGFYASTIVDAGANNLDGFGSTYTLESDYENKTFIADGSNWFIL